MRVCPICKARCFDDMEICYGCLHRFDGDGMREGILPSAAMPEAEGDAVERVDEAESSPSAKASDEPIPDEPESLLPAEGAAISVPSEPARSIRCDSIPLGESGYRLVIDIRIQAPQAG